ncbi:MAG: hypothetical protein GY862_17270 [Gammaproteobacteria bacterium]|nr:hypothetical protein [Gammaproteobacteria bacterium]
MAQQYVLRHENRFSEVTAYASPSSATRFGEKSVRVLFYLDGEKCGREDDYVPLPDRGRDLALPPYSREDEYLAEVMRWTVRIKLHSRAWEKCVESNAKHSFFGPRRPAHPPFEQVPVQATGNKLTIAGTKFCYTKEKGLHEEHDETEW